MKRIQVLLLFIVISCSMFAQDRLSLFIGRANKYAAVELSDYRKRLCVEYNISNQLLDDYYRRCGKHEKDDRPEIRGKEHYVLGWDNKEKIAVLQAEVRQLQQEEKMTAAKVRKLEEDIKNAQKKRETYLTLFSKYDKFDDIDWKSKS